ncbi:MAG: NAD-dependent aldehyde dehydrogenase [Sandaracinaceae bacterium]
MTSPQFATHAPQAASTALETVDRLVARLVARKDDWVKTSIETRIDLLKRCIERTEAVAEDWVAAACRAKGLSPESPQGGEEWLAGPMVLVRNMRLLVDALEAGGQPAPTALRQRANGQHVARVFPADHFDRLLMGGITADVWIEPGKAPSQGKIYRDKADGHVPEGKVALVLGAGNVASIGPMDALYKLFVEDEVVLVKTNPVNAYLQPYWEESFAPLGDADVFFVVRGGVEVGKHAVHHPDIDTIHLTGSDRTHDAIVWGAQPDEQARRKQTGERLVNKHITSELGCVTPVLIVPGQWSSSDIDFQARHIAAMVANNGSFNCNAAKVVALGDRWPQREMMIERIEHHLRETPPRRAYYPGAQERYDGFLERYPQAEPMGPRSDAVVPWTVIRDVPPNPGEYALTNEAFCGVLGTTLLKAGDPAAFLDAMVDFANDACWGTLSCSILIHPRTRRQYASKFDRAIERLKFGGIAINLFPGVIYGLSSPSWGAFPGHPMHDIRSGRGVVHNAFLYDHPQKSVVEGPFRIFPTPAWFADNRNTHRLGRAMTRFEARPGIVRLPGVLGAAMKG